MKRTITNRRANSILFYSGGQNQNKQASSDLIYLYMACCHYALTEYEKAEDLAKKCERDTDPLKRRILFHTAVINFLKDYTVFFQKTQYNLSKNMRYF